MFMILWILFLRESRLAGKNAARYIMNGENMMEECLKLKQEPEFPYVVPNFVLADTQEGGKFICGVKSIYRDAKILVKSGDKVIKSKKLKGDTFRNDKYTIEKRGFGSVENDICVEVEGL